MIEEPRQSIVNFPQGWEYNNGSTTTFMGPERDVKRPVTFAEELDSTSLPREDGGWRTDSGDGRIAKFKCCHPSSY